MSMEELMRKLETIEKNMATKQDLEGLATKQDLESLATHEDVMHVSDTLQSITDETAVSLQDKQEAGDVLLKSLVDGLREEMHKRFDSVDQRFENLEERLANMHNTMIDGFNKITEIMQTWVEKQKMVDTELRFHLHKIVNNERATEELQRRVKELESGSGS